MKAPKESPCVHCGKPVFLMPHEGGAVAVDPPIVQGRTLTGVFSRVQLLHKESCAGNRNGKVDAQRS
jgi:hypothetical protein